MKEAKGETSFFVVEDYIFSVDEVNEILDYLDYYVEKHKHQETRNEKTSECPFGRKTN